jgi:predicted alpha/beta hydrolase family esterase
VLFVQGAGKSVHDEWDEKLVRNLERELGDGYTVRYPRMPNEADPKYSAWRPVLRTELEHLQDGALVVGHSVGGTMLIHVLAERLPQVALGAVFLIAAPFIGEGGWPSDELEPRDELGARLPDDLPVFLYHGTADETVPVSHLALYGKAIPQATTRRLAERDHQLDNRLSEVARDIESLRAHGG